MRTLVRLTVMAVMASALGGCVRHYREPSLGEPHALVRVRIVRHSWAGPMIDESVRLGSYAISMPREGPEPSIRAVRVRPELAEWRFETNFFHIEQRPQLETYRESYSCGSQTSYSGGHSHSQPRTCYRTRSRTVYRTVQVPHASCRTGLRHLPMAGAAYLIEYDFMGDGQCTAQCFRQIPQPGGRFRLLPCGAAEPPATSPVAAAPSPTPRVAPRSATPATGAGALGAP